MGTERKGLTSLVSSLYAMAESEEGICICSSSSESLKNKNLTAGLRDSPLVQAGRMSIDLCGNFYDVGVIFIWLVGTDPNLVSSCEPLAGNPWIFTSAG